RLRRRPRPTRYGAWADKVGRTGHHNDNGRRREEAQPYDRAGGRGGKGKMKALAVTAGIVFWTLVLGIAWLAFFPGSESSGPVAVLQIEPATVPGPGAPAGGSGAESDPGPA